MKCKYCGVEIGNSLECHLCGHKQIGKTTCPVCSKLIYPYQEYCSNCGSTTIYAFLEAVGIINDHLDSCFRKEEVVRIGKK